jgi:hypothetical protein
VRDHGCATLVLCYRHKPLDRKAQDSLPSSPPKAIAGCGPHQKRLQPALETGGDPLRSRLIAEDVRQEPTSAVAGDGYGVVLVAIREDRSTGPKISSRAIRMSFLISGKTAGRTK